MILGRIGEWLIGPDDAMSRLRDRSPAAALEMRWRDGAEAMIDQVSGAIRSRPQSWGLRRPERFRADAAIEAALRAARAPSGNYLLERPARRPATFMGRPIAFTDDPAMAGRLVLESLA